MKLTFIQAFCRARYSSLVERRRFWQVRATEYEVYLIYLCCLEKLSGAKYGTKSDIEVMTRNFDKTTKINYKSASKYSYIRFGRDENDPLHGILSGGIKLNR